MSFIAADIGAPAFGAVSSAIGGGWAADMAGIVPPPIGTLIAEIQLDPAKQLGGGTADASAQSQRGSAFPLQSDSSPAGSPSLNADDQRTVDGVFKPNG
jgi:hypothetical protein